MKTTLTKLISLLAAGALVLSLAACGGGDETNTTAAQGNTQAGASETVPPADDTSTQANESTTDTGATGTDVSGSNAATTEASSTTGTTKAGNQQKPDGNASKAPSGVNGIVGYYNAAVKKIAKVSGTYTRKIQTGTVTGVPSVIAKGGTLDLTEARFANEINKTNAALTADMAKLAALSASDVSNATCKENGNSYTLTFTLKKQSGTDGNIKLGKGGYMYFVDYSATKAAVDVVADVLGVGGITTKSATMTVSNGKLTVIADKNTGKIKSATLALSENISAAASHFLARNLSASIQLTASASYTVA